MNSCKEQFLNQKEVAQLVYLASLFTPTATFDDRQRGEILSHVLKKETLESLTPALRDFAFQLLADFLYEPANRSILDSLLLQHKIRGEKDPFLKRLSRWVGLVDTVFQGFLTGEVKPFIVEPKDGGLFVKVARG